MPYFKKLNLLFIHIPKTGGTSLECYIAKKFKECLNKFSLVHQFNNELPENYSGTSLYSFFNKPFNDNLPNRRYPTMMHMSYQLIHDNQKILGVDFNEKLKVITIVRNPYTRLVSSLFFNKIINVSTTKEQVTLLIKKFLKSNTQDEHNIPQYKFLIFDGEMVNAVVFHQETLVDDLEKYGFTKFKETRFKNCENVNYFDYLNRTSLDIINQFYSKDFELFGYSKI